MGLGPIPYLAILQYADLMDLDSELREDLIYVIRKMDNTYLKLENSKHGSKKSNKDNSNNGR